MRTMYARQKGMGMSGILFMLVVAIFSVTVIFKLGPSYMGFMTLKSIMNGISESSEPILGGKPAIMKVLENRMMVNDVRSIESKSFAVKKLTDDTFELSVAYEQRQHLFFNIDTVLTFNHAVVVKGR